MEISEYGAGFSRAYVGTGCLSASAGGKRIPFRSSRVNFCFENPMHIRGAQHYVLLWVVNSFLLRGFMARFRLCHLLNLMQDSLPLAF